MLFVPKFSTSVVLNSKFGVGDCDYVVDVNSFDSVDDAHDVEILVSSTSTFNYLNGYKIQLSQWR